MAKLTESFNNKYYPRITRYHEFYTIIPLYVLCIGK